MAHQVLEISDIFVGSIDAKDDVMNSLSEKEFIESFIMPPNFEIKDVIEKNKYYIEGYKGTGKTALLNYLSNYIKKNNGYEYFILFKSDYKTSDKSKLENIAQNTIKVDRESLKEESDFEYIWRWIILDKIIDFNIKSNFSLFKNNYEWQIFEKTVKSFSKSKNSRSLFDLLPFKVGSADYSIKLPKENIIHNFSLKGIEVEKIKNKNIDFTSLLEKSIELFSVLTPKQDLSIMFIDELEAFYEDKEMFLRDLRMIRDLILTVKYFNDLFCKLKYNNFKLVSAIRTEVLESIRTHISAKEINKAIYSFRKELKWNYANTTAYQHPIIQVWLKRIKVAEIKHNEIELNDSEIVNKWFTEKINNDSTISYILDNSWCKPRDVVRFLQSASNVSPKNTKYDQNVFDSLRKEYSKESWKEIFEELNSIYSPEEIDLIKDFFMCYRRYFSFADATSRAKYISEQSKTSFLTDNLLEILRNLYRVGCIGNMSVDKRYYRWRHKGDDSLVIDDSKLYLVVHCGLWSELSLFYIHVDNKKEEPLKVGDIVNCKVYRLNKSFVYVNILESNIDGSIHIKHISEENRFVKNIYKEVNIGEEFKAKIIEFDDKYGIQLSRKVV